MLYHFQLISSLKTSKNQRFSDVFRGYRSGTLVEKGLNTYENTKFYSKKSMKNIAKLYT